MGVGDIIGVIVAGEGVSVAGEGVSVLARGGVDEGPAEEVRTEVTIAMGVDVRACVAVALPGETPPSQRDNAPKPAARITEKATAHPRGGACLRLAAGCGASALCGPGT